jgi:hypothetical protein
MHANVPAPNQISPDGVWLPMRAARFAAAPNASASISSTSPVVIATRIVMLPSAVTASCMSRAARRASVAATNRHM